jgi:hypothetical protein
VATATSSSPKKVVTPTKHGLKMKKAPATTSKEVKASSSNLRTTTSHDSSPEIPITDYRRPKPIASSNLVSKSLDSTTNPGSFCQVPVSPFFSNGAHDAAASSKLITESILLSPSLEGKDQSAASAPLQLDSKSFATVNTNNTNNKGSETIKDQLQEEDDDDDDEVFAFFDTHSLVFYRKPFLKVPNPDLQLIILLSIELCSGSFILAICGGGEVVLRFFHSCNLVVARF